MTLILFWCIAAAVAAVWNRLFDRVRWRMVVLFCVAITAYQWQTFFTSRVDIPANLLFIAYPWKATGRPHVLANTGIVITELVPWTQQARLSLKSGEAPLWNRTTGCGSPLLANQQTAIFHPFTLAGLVLPIGKAWTLSVALRLFFLLFFGFVFVRQWARESAALYGAVAFAFSTFSIVWLLFPIGLAISALPLVLVGVTEWAHRPGRRSFLLLTAALALLILSGHPETELMVGLMAGAFTLYLSRGKLPILGGAAGAAITAAALTAFFWWPTVALIPFTARYQLMEAVRSAPPGPRVGREWLVTLLLPNALGVPQRDSYRTPPPVRPDLLNDYGEVASGYAGLLSLPLALLAIRRRWRESPVMFLVASAVIALLTIAEVPGWMDAFRKMPVIGIMLHQRLRFVWAFSVSVLAAIGLGALPMRRAMHSAAVVIVAVDLLATTWRYNPPALARDLYPATGAIESVRGAGGRFVAMGWSFLPDTPGYYGISDIKTTDPMQSPEYGRVMQMYLDIGPADYNQEPRDLSHSFVDFLGVQRIYVPPGHAFSRRDTREVYSGADGAVFENIAALPAAYFVASYFVDEAFGLRPELQRREVDFAREAILHHVPPQVARQDTWQKQNVQARRYEGLGGMVRMRSVRRNEETIDVVSRGWNLLVTNNAWSPAWRGWWNGGRAPVVRVNGAFVGMLTPPGNGSVRFAYRPVEFDRGILLAGLTLLAIFLGIGSSVLPLSGVPRGKRSFKTEIS